MSLQSSRSSTEDSLLVDRAIELVRRWSGIRVPDRSRPLVVEVLLRAGHGQLAAGAERVLAGQRRALQRLVEVLCVPESYLFRHAAHFLLLQRFVAKRRRQNRALCVLSAGCSTGEEAWSVAAVLARCPPPPGSRDTVQGWDLSHRHVTVARAGRYGGWAVRGGLHGHDAFFEQVSEGWQVRPRLREVAAFSQVNLVSDPYPTGPLFDVIFFRNVATRWDASASTLVLTRLLERLAPDGIAIVGPNDRFDPLRGAAMRHIDGVRVITQATDYHDFVDGELRAAVAKRPFPPTALPVPLVGPKGGPAARFFTDRRTRLLSPPERSTRWRRVSTDPRAADAVAAPVAARERHIDPDTVREVAALADAGAYEDALLALTRRPAQDCPDYARWEGILQLNLCRPERALRSFRRSVRLGPNSVQNRHWLAVAYEACGRVEEAERERRLPKEPLL